MRNKQAETAKRSETTALFAVGNKAGKGTTKKVIILVVIAIIVFAGSVGAFYLLSRTSPTSVVNDEEQSSEDEAATNSVSVDLYNRVSEVVSDQGYGAAQKVYEEEVKKTDDKNAQAAIYIEQSILATNNGDMVSAVAYARKAEDLVQSGMTAGLLANTAYDISDKATALTYYELAISRTDNWAGQEDVLSFYEQRIEELKK